MSIFYDIFIFPIEFLMQIVLEKALTVTGSPLFSLVLLSFIVSLFSWPIYSKAESWQKKEKDDKERLDKKIREFKSVFKGAVLNRYIQTLYRQNNYHPIYAARTSFGFLIQIPFFFAAYHLLSNYSPFNGVETVLFNDLGKPDSILNFSGITINLMPFVMTAVNFVAVAFYGKRSSFKDNIQLYGIAVIFFVILYNSSSALLFYWTVNNVFSLVKNIVYNKVYDKGAITGKVKLNSGKIKRLPKIINSMVSIVPESNSGYDTVFRRAFFAFCFLVFVTIPQTVLSSGSRSDFEGSGFYYLVYTVLFASVIFITILIVFINSSLRMKTVMSFCVSFLLLYSLINAFVFSDYYGDMSHFVFSEGIEVEQWWMLLNSFLGVVMLLLCGFLLFRFPELFAKLILVISVSLAVLSAVEVYDFYSIRKQTDDKISGDHMFRFSRSGRNVVILMLDRFIGGFVPQILDLQPELKQDLEGFVYYENTLSPGSYTIGGVPAIMGGWEYTVRNINHSRNDVPLLDKLDESARILPYNFDKAGFNVYMITNDISSWFKNDIRENIGKSVFIEPDFPLYRKKWFGINEQNSDDDDNSIRKKLIAFGVFRAAPIIFREWIYDNSEWHIDTDRDVKSTEEEKDKEKFVYSYQKSRHRRDITLKYYAVMDFLPELSTVSDESGDSFYYMTNDLTHEPHMIGMDFKFDITGRIKFSRDIYKKFRKNKTSLKHLYTDGAALRLVNEWLKWMKDNGVYDNTRIIIVSDHGRAMYDPYFRQQKIPGAKRAPGAKKKAHPADFDNLLLVKDFNSKGNLRFENEFMSSADVPALALQGIIDGINPYTGGRIMIPENKFPYYMYDIHWRVEKHEKYRYKIFEGYAIDENDCINPSEWRVIHE